VVLETPVHVGQKLIPGLSNLRHKNIFPLVRDAIHASADRFGMRIIHYCVLRNHLHLIVEARSTRALTKGMQGLLIRIAKRLNNRLGRTGPVFVERYFSNVLTSNEYVRSALNYVLKNALRHKRQLGKKVPSNWIDPCSSSHRFTGWDEVRITLPDDDLPIGRPRSYALREGWMYGYDPNVYGGMTGRLGLSLNDIPGPARG
jgi:REP element-mobilizing transposase RayT